jgi:hypothetical protein
MGCVEGESWNVNWFTDTILGCVEGEELIVNELKI